MIITALLGNPTSHSVSPRLFSVYAKEHNLEYAHLKIDVQPDKLYPVLEAARLLGFNGLNITVPYKSDVVRYLDRIDTLAEKIGAVNTIVIRNEKLYGYNTDLYEAIRAIEEKIKRSINSRDKCLVIGTGGAARAIVQGLIQRKSSVTVCYREPKSIRTNSLMKDLRRKVEFIKNTKEIVRFISKANIVCNATSAGMYPHINELPLKKQFIAKAAK